METETYESESKTEETRSYEAQLAEALKQARTNMAKMQLLTQTLSRLNEQNEELKMKIEELKRKTESYESESEKRRKKKEEKKLVAPKKTIPVATRRRSLLGKGEETREEGKVICRKLPILTIDPQTGELVPVAEIEVCRKSQRLSLPSASSTVVETETFPASEEKENRGGRWKEEYQMLARENLQLQLQLEETYGKMEEFQSAFQEKTNLHNRVVERYATAMSSLSRSFVGVKKKYPEDKDVSDMQSLLSEFHHSGA